MFDCREFCTLASRTPVPRSNDQGTLLRSFARMKVQQPGQVHAVAGITGPRGAAVNAQLSKLIDSVTMEHTSFTQKGRAPRTRGP